MRAVSAKALYILLLSTLLRFQRDHHRHELQNKDIQFLHIKLYTLFVHQTVHPTYMTENFPQKNLLNLCIGSEEPVLLL